MRVLLERFIISSTPAWRVLLAVFSSTPFFLIVLFGHGWALAAPAIRAGLNPDVMLMLQAVLALASVLNIGLGCWLWPRRQWPQPVPAETLLVCLSIGLVYTFITIAAGIFTAGTNLVLLGVLAIGLLLFDVKPMWITYLICLSALILSDLGFHVGLWPYAPALTDRVFDGREPVWWFAIWREFIFITGYVVLLSLMLLLMDRLDAVLSKLRRLSYTDGLTGLANRRRFMEVLHNEVARQARTGQVMSVVLIDVDHFKRVNDEHGHAVGDEVLRALGRLLMGCVRSPTDLASRLGGEEFALLLPDTRTEQADAVCKRLREQLAAQYFGEGEARFRITLSMGLVECVGQDAEQVLRQADQLLYRAKSLGRDRVCMVGAAMGAT